MTENSHCADCGMLCEPPAVFHPQLYCRLFKAGFLNPAALLEGQRFIPDPTHWGEDAPEKQRQAVAARHTVTVFSRRIVPA